MQRETLGNATPATTGSSSSLRQQHHQAAVRGHSHSPSPTPPTAATAASLTSLTGSRSLPVAAAAATQPALILSTKSPRHIVIRRKRGPVAVAGVTPAAAGGFGFTLRHFIVYPPEVIITHLSPPDIVLGI